MGSLFLIEVRKLLPHSKDARSSSYPEVGSLEATLEQGRIGVFL